MPSPTAIFTSLTQVQRDALRVTVLARLSTGDRTSLSALGKSGGKSWPMTPQDMLFELNYADNQAAGVARPQKVTNDLVNSAWSGNITIP